MGNKTLHSITFPGLADKYISPEMASEFSSSIAYAIGDYVTKEGTLYRFTTAHAAGSWNAGHVSAVKIGKEVSDLKSALVSSIKSEKSTFKIFTTFINGDPTSPNSKYRIHSSTYMSFDYDIVISVQSGFRFGLWVMEAESSVWKGWNTADKKIESGTSFKIMITRSPEDTSEIANIDDFVSKVTFILVTKNIESDINEIKNEISTINDRLCFNPTEIFEIGDLTVSNGSLNTLHDGRRVRTPLNLEIYLKSGSVIGLFDFSIAKIRVIQKDSFGVYTDLGWKTSNYTIPADGTYHFVITAQPEAVQSSPNDLASLFVGYYPNIFDTIDGNSEDIDNIYTVNAELYPGYLNDTGVVVESTSTKHTEKIPCEYGDVFDIFIKFTASKSMWVAYAKYDDNENFIGRTTVAETSNLAYQYHYQINIVDQNAKYIVFMFRTVDDESFQSAKITTSSRINGIVSSLKKLQTKYAHVVSDDTYVKSINHRGWYNAPENTLPAFLESKQHGFNYVECDVSFTSDGVPVLLHDVSINRTARNEDGTTLSDTINIYDITYEDLLDYDFGIYKGEQYAGTTIPTFEEFLRFCKKIGLKPYVEIKANQTHSQARIDGLVSLVKSCGMEEHITWISGAVGNLTKVQNTTTKGRYGFVVAHVTDITENDWTGLLALKTAENEIFVDSYTYTSSEISTCKNKGVPLEVYTINSSATIKTMDAYITGITSDMLIASDVLYKSVL